MTEGPTPDRVAFTDALRKVPAEQRRALVLYYVCDLSVAQIATETGVPDGTVKARLARGRAALAPTCVDQSGSPRAGEPSAADRRGRAMSELGDELHRLADRGAEQARPLPAAEIVRRGDQRRRRRMVGGTVASLAVAGAITGGPEPHAVRPAAGTREEQLTALPPR